MSDVHGKISRWRASIEPRLGPQAADELEDHLRSTIESLKPTGLPDEERLIIASHRLGSTAQLSQEFAKNDLSGVWRRRAAWMLVGFVPLHWLVRAIQDAAGKLESAFVMRGLPAWGAAAISLVLTSFVVLGILAIGLRFSATRGRRQSASVAWLHTPLAMRAALLAVVFLALNFAPRVVLSLYGGRAMPVGRASELNEFLLKYSAVARLISVIFSTTSAVALAWLMAAPRAGQDALSSDPA